jgi:hypothetical protein
MRIRMSKIAFITLLFVITACTFGASRGDAATLDLLGVGWDKSEVTVLIKSAPGVTPQAVHDVEAAVSDDQDEPLVFTILQSEMPVESNPELYENIFAAAVRHLS